MPLSTILTLSALVLGQTLISNAFAQDLTSPAPSPAEMGPQQVSEVPDPSPLETPLPHLVPIASALPITQEQTPPSTLTVQGRLRKNVDFWISIYSLYSSTEGLIHDSKYVDIVYEKISFAETPSKKKKMIREGVKKYKKILLNVHRKRNDPDKMDAEEKRIFELFKDIPDSNRFLDAAHRKRVRFQLGQKDRFLEGLVESGRYLPIMEEIFKREGLPIELTRLPFVESSFNVRARSKVGASGIWQFMRSTGRFFLKINSAIDERNDPIRATEAAAKLLKVNYDSLKNWPLAITAYNHGRMGMMRAVRKVGTEDIEGIVDGYKSRSFGFASSNFYTELLAAIEVERNAEKYFGPIERATPLKGVEIQLPESIKFKDLVQYLKLDEEAIKSLNPALSGQVILGRALIPAGYYLRIPHDPVLQPEAAARVFLAGFTQIPSINKRKGKVSEIYGTGKLQKVD